MAKVFDGLDDIDWGGMNHAYGPAEDVPGWVRGLVDDDAAVREECLDAMYGAVHHQGDVYDSTVAAVPYLLNIATSDLPGRGEVVRLLASIGASDHEEPIDDISEEFEGVTYTVLLGTGRRLVAEARPLFLGLLDDPDPAVRSGAAEALAASRDDVADIVDALRTRVATEPDRDVRSTLVATVAALGRMAATGHATGIAAEEITAWLTSRTMPAGTSGSGGTSSGGTGSNASADSMAGAAPGADRDRLAEAIDRLDATDALLRAENARDRSDPGRTPDAPHSELVDRVLADLATVYDHSDSSVEPAGFHTETLIGAHRELREEAQSGRRAPEAAEAVRSLAEALDDRVAARSALLLALLGAARVEPRLDAVGPAAVVVQSLRGEHRPLVEAMATGLDQSHDGLVFATVSNLRNLDRLAEPAADALAVLVARGDADNDHPLGWFQVWAGDGRVTVADPLSTLAGAGDPRAVEPLGALLGRKVVPEDLGYVIARMGEAALPLLPDVVARLGGSGPSPTGARRMLRRVVPGAGSADGSAARAADLGGATQPLLRAMGVLGRLAPEQAVAAGAVDVLLAHLPDDLAIAALGALGPHARVAVDRLLPLLDPSGSPFALGRVATTLGLVGGPADVVIDAVRPRLRGDVAHQAIAALQPFGPAAASVLDLLTPIAASDDEADPHGWKRAEAGASIWAITGQADLALPALKGAWRANVHTRTGVAGVWAEMGAAAASAQPLVDAERTDPRRFGARSSGWSSAQIRDDLTLLAALDAIAF